MSIESRGKNSYETQNLNDLSDYCRRHLDTQLVKDYALFLDYGPSPTERQIMQATEEMIQKGEEVELTEDEFKKMVEEEYDFPRA